MMTGLGGGPPDQAAAPTLAHPLSSGKAVASSAVTSASGTLHTKGRMAKPSSASSGPAEVTAS